MQFPEIPPAAWVFSVVSLPVNTRCSLTGFGLICRCRTPVQNGWSTWAPPISAAQSRALGKVKTGSQSTASSAGTAANDYLILSSRKGSLPFQETREGSPSFGFAVREMLILAGVISRKVINLFHSRHFSWKNIHVSHLCIVVFCRGNKWTQL